MFSALITIFKINEDLESIKKEFRRKDPSRGVRYETLKTRASKVKACFTKMNIAHQDGIFKKSKWSWS